MLKDILLPAVEYYRNKEEKLSHYTMEELKLKEREYTKLDNMWNRKLMYEGFVNKLVPIIGSLPVQSPSFSDVMRNIPKVLKAKDGQTYTKEEVKAILGILQRMPNRSILVKKGSPLYPRYAGMTPLVMYAFREIQNIKYEYWDKDDKKYDLLLNSTLLQQGIEQAKKVVQPSINEIVEARNYQIDNDKPLSSHMRAAGYAALFPDMYMGGMAFSHSLMQTWLCQPGTRVEDAMMLNFYDLDNIPIPIELRAIPIEKKPAKAPTDEYGI